MTVSKADSEVILTIIKCTPDETPKTQVNLHINNVLFIYFIFILIHNHGKMALDHYLVFVGFVRGGHDGSQN